MAYKHSQIDDPIFVRHAKAAVRGSKRSAAWLSQRGWAVGQAAAVLELGAEAIPSHWTPARVRRIKGGRTQVELPVRRRR